MCIIGMRDDVHRIRRTIRPVLLSIPLIIDRVQALSNASPPVSSLSSSSNVKIIYRDIETCRDLRL